MSSRSCTPFLTILERYPHYSRVDYVILEMCVSSWLLPIYCVNEKCYSVLAICIRQVDYLGSEDMNLSFIPDLEVWCYVTPSGSLSKRGSQQNSSQLYHCHTKKTARKLSFLPPAVHNPGFTSVSVN